MLLSEYVNDLQENKIRSHKDALKYFPVRYTTFNPTNYSKDFTLPGCTLAKYGFYYDNTQKLIRCFECQFEYNDLEQGLLTTIMHKHYKHCMDCPQVLSSLDHFLDNDLKISESCLIGSQEKDVDNTLISYDNKYLSEVIRLKTYENIPIRLNQNQLAQNGLYLILLKDTLSKTSRTQIDQISIHVPSLFHIKCAFCPYECLLSKTSQLNTNYKSPVQEHKEQFSKICSIFKNTKVDNYNDFSWLNNLLKLTTKDQNNNLDNLIKDLITLNGPAIQNLNDLIVKQIPKAIDQLIHLETTKNQSIIYAPCDLMGLSDFAKLQVVLNQSDNVISEKSYHPAFSMHHKRLESFDSWPSGVDQDAKDLARAGFYYFGVKDMVKCFFCNGGLRDWRKGDDPYEDHVRWFPKCQFIRQLMGVEYVENIKKKYKDKESGFDDEILKNINEEIEKKTNPEIIVGSKNNTKTNRSVNPRLLNSILDTSLIREILDAQILNKDLVEQVLEADLIKERQSSETVFEVAKKGLDLADRKAKWRNDLEMISDLVICGLMSSVTVDDIRALISFQFGVVPSVVRIIREYGQYETRCISLVCLKKKDTHLIEKIAKELNPKYFLLTKIQGSLQVFETNWPKFEEQVGAMLQTTESIQSNQNTNKTSIVPEKTNITNLNLKEDSDNLRDENERLKNERLCAVCLINDKNMLFLPCAHLASCLDCSFNMQNCPLCRSKIQATVRTYS